MAAPGRKRPLFSAKKQLRNLWRPGFLSSIHIYCVETFGSTFSGSKRSAWLRLSSSERLVYLAADISEGRLAD